MIFYRYNVRFRYQRARRGEVTEEWRSAIISTDGTAVGLESRYDDELAALFRQAQVNSHSKLDRRWERTRGPKQGDS